MEILDGFEIRRAAVETGIPCLTSLDTARAVVEALATAPATGAAHRRVPADREASARPAHPGNFT